MRWFLAMHLQTEGCFRSYRPYHYEVEEAKQEDVALREAGEASAEAREATDEPLDLIAFLVEGSIILPWIDTIGRG